MAYIHQHVSKKHDHEKIQEARIEDAAYMLNHAVACTITDVFEAEINTAFHNKFVFYLPKSIQPYLANFKVGCGCSGRHSIENHGDHNVGVNATYGKALAAEFIADFGSVPLVLAAQRYAPGQMKKIQNAVEPWVGGVLHKRAEASAALWATNRGISLNSDAYHQQVDDIYDHEISHLPQAILWTGLSLGIHAVGQKALGINAPWLGVISAKLVSSAVIFGGVVGTRFTAPSAMRKLDQFTTKYFISPATIALGDAVGLDPDIVRNFVKKEEMEIAQQKAFERVNKGETLDPEDIQVIREARQEGQELMRQEQLKKNLLPGLTVRMASIDAHKQPELFKDTPQ